MIGLAIVIGLLVAAAVGKVSFNRVVLILSGFLALFALYSVLDRVGVPLPVAIGAFVLAYFALLHAIFDWPWRPGSWWKFPLVTVAWVAVASSIPSQYLSWLVAAAVAIALVVSYVQRQRSA
jgi:hypothetical protein